MDPRNVKTRIKKWCIVNNLPYWDQSGSGPTNHFVMECLRSDLHPWKHNQEIRSISFIRPIENQLKDFPQQSTGTTGNVYY